MKNSIDFPSKNWKKINFYFMIFLYLSILLYVKCNSSCEDSYGYPKDINNKKCFNNIIQFENKKYRANNFATNKKGDLILELTELKEDGNSEVFASRLFYGITKEGYPFFVNNTSYLYEIQINESKKVQDDNEFHKLYNWNNSINLFISIKNDSNKPETVAIL